MFQHDVTVQCVTTAPGVYNGILPPYAAAFFIELYSDDSGYDMIVHCLNYNFCIVIFAAYNL